MTAGPGDRDAAPVMAFPGTAAGDGAWQAAASCAAPGINAGAFFPEKGERTGYARRVCASCPVRQRCLEYALDFERDMGAGTRHGIWGGLTPDERWEADRAARKTAA